MAKNKITKRKALKKKLTDKYRLVILNENTFEERFSLKLSRLNVFVLGGVFSIILIFLTSVLIAFTPIKEYIPGYASTTQNRKITKLIIESDSLQKKLAVLEQYTKAIPMVLRGEIKPEKIDSLALNSTQKNIDSINLHASKSDSIFREKVESRDRFPLIEGNQNKAKIVFFAPITGSITQKFDAKNNHFAIDIATKVGTPVKAIANGMVILSEWTVETGYVIILQHADNFISVYKHNGDLLKRQGDYVKLGEVIAKVGSTGELTTGPHLHFELWNNEFPINPANYIDFQ